MKNITKYIKALVTFTTKSDNANKQNSIECNYADNYYGDQKCQTS